LKVSKFTVKLDFIVKMALCLPTHSIFGMIFQHSGVPPDCRGRRPNPSRHRFLRQISLESPSLLGGNPTRKLPAFSPQLKHEPSRSSTLLHHHLRYDKGNIEMREIEEIVLASAYKVADAFCKWKEAQIHEGSVSDNNIIQAEQAYREAGAQHSALILNLSHIPPSERSVAFGRVERSGYAAGERSGR
jgi:hypothetical protein